MVCHGYILTAYHFGEVNLLKSLLIKVNHENKIRYFVNYTFDLKVEREKKKIIPTVNTKYVDDDAVNFFLTNMENCFAG